MKGGTGARVDQGAALRLERRACRERGVLMTERPRCLSPLHFHCAQLDCRRFVPSQELQRRPRRFAVDNRSAQLSREG